MLAPRTEAEMRTTLIAATMAAMSFSAWAQGGPTSGLANSADDQAGDRMAEILYMVPHDRIVDAGSSDALVDPRVILPNDGARTTIAAGCEVSCTAIHVTLRAPGLPEIS